MKYSQDIFSYLMQSRRLVSDRLWKVICSSIVRVLPVLQVRTTPSPPAAVELLRLCKF